MLKLKAEARDKKSDIDAIRKAGNVPAVFYGKNTEAISISMVYGDFMRVWKDAGESTIITLETKDGDKNVLIQDVQVHPVTGDPLHVDFYTVLKGQKLTVDVPLEFVGEAPIEKTGGVVVKVIHELEIESEPQNLPSEIEVDLSVLKEVGDHILVKDVVLPDGVETTLDPEEIVVSTAEAREDEEPEETEEIDLDSIKVAGEESKEDDDSSEEEAEDEE